MAENEEELKSLLIKMKEESEKADLKLNQKSKILWHSGGSAVNNLPAIRETPVQSMGWEDPLEKGKATHSRILAWGIPWTV